MPWRRALLLPIVLAALVSCGGDDEAAQSDVDVDDTTATTAVTTGDSDPVVEETTAETTEGTTEATTEETTAGSAPSGELAEFCPPMEELANYNALSGTPDISGEWADLQDELLDSAGEALPLYDDAIATAPDEARGNLETLRDYSREILTAVEESSSFEDFVAAVGTPPNGVLEATQDLNSYITENCGFGLTESG